MEEKRKSILLTGASKKKKLKVVLNETAEIFPSSPEGFWPTDESDQSLDTLPYFPSDSDSDSEENTSPESPPNVDFNFMKCFKGKKSSLYAFHKSSSLYITGACKIQVLFGNLTCFGYDFIPGDKIYDIYSLRGWPQLYLSHRQDNIENNNNENNKTVQMIQKLGFNRKVINEILTNYLTNDYGIIGCFPLENNSLKYIDKCVSVTILPPKLDDNSIQATFEYIPNEQALKISNDWNEIVDYHDDDQNVMICGGKGVGKSTLLRYMINKLLNYHPKLYVLDLDPGQSEFTMSGCISLVCIENPIFGPNYTHQIETIRSISQNIDVSYTPKNYIESVQSLYQTYLSLEKAPTLVNMMGFTKGLGIEITSSVIVMINPKVLIEIRCDKQQKNYSKALVKGTIYEHFSTFFPYGFLEGTLSYEYICIDSLVEMENTGFKPAGFLSRNISTISYFGKVLDKNLTLRSGFIPMFKIQLNQITVIDNEYKVIKPSNKAAVINANIVALCSTSNDEPVYTCYGYGIVRCIMDNELYLITPVKYPTIQQVTHFIIGLVEIPTAMLEENFPYDKPVPYFSSGCLSELMNVPRRSFLPRKSL